jgi:hypothetical protein
MPGNSTTCRRERIIARAHQPSLSGASARHIKLGISMPARDIAEIAMHASGQLLITPAAPAQSDEMIYRAGAGVQWDSNALGFVAAESHRWQPVELVRHIARTVRAELGDDLRPTHATKWSGVPAQLRSEITHALAFQGKADA